MSLLELLTAASLPTDLYALFSLTRPTFTPSLLKKRYYALALAHHPDRDPSSGAKVKFQAVSAAYELMSDAGRRADYDDHGLPAEGDGEDMSEPDEGWAAYFRTIFKKVRGREHPPPQAAKDPHRFLSTH